MAVNFVQQKKKQKYLLFVAIGILLVAVIILYFGYFKKEVSVPAISFPEVENITPDITTKLTIDLSVLDNPFLKHSEPFITILPFEGKVGRVNPFLPY